MIPGLWSWGWIVAGLLLACLEVVVPGTFLIWMGLAAIVTGIVEAVFDLGLTWNLIAFAVAMLAFCWIGRRVYGSVPKATDRPFLNRRTEALVGREFVLDHPIENGVGRIRVDDTVWRVAGPDAPSGTRVKVMGAGTGVDLRVEKAG